MNPALELLKDKTFPVLNDGFIRVIDVMGTDSDVVDAARISYGKATRKISEDRDLLRYLLRNKHSTPFEMCEVKIHVRVPMDTWRQWIRHRAASVNEYSTRYSEAIDSKQTTPPDGWRLQAKDNKQGSGGTLIAWTGHCGKPNNWNYSEEHRLDHQARLMGKLKMSEPLTPGQALSIMEAGFHKDAAEVYRQRLAMGVAREQARKDLPLSTFTEAIWKCDLRNLLGFLALRMDSHAQLEIRQYASIIGNEIVAKLFPVTWEAFRDYQLESVTLSRLDIEVIRKLDGFTPPVGESEFLNAVASADVGWDGKRCRERDECRDKLIRLGLIRVA